MYPRKEYKNTCPIKSSQTGKVRLKTPINFPQIICLSSRVDVNKIGHELDSFSDVILVDERTNVKSVPNPINIMA